MTIHPYIWPPIDLDEETTMLHKQILAAADIANKIEEQENRLYRAQLTDGTERRPFFNSLNNSVRKGDSTIFRCIDAERAKEIADDLNRVACDEEERRLEQMRQKMAEAFATGG